jgi:glycosyltransferase involved in cell wall biosynthesis
MKTPMISIIIPVYGVEKYLEECIESILKQTFKDFELILVDDRSKDSSGQICDRYAATDDRIKVLHNKINSGPATSRNNGLDVAKGEYICFVDADDFIFEHYLESLYNTAVSENVRIVACNHVNYQDGATPVRNKKTDPELVRYVDDMERILDDIDHTERYVVLWNKIYHSSIWKDLRLPDGKFSEDTYIFYKILDLCKEFVYIDEVLYARRLNESSVTHAAYHMKNWNFVEAKCEQLEYFSKQKRQPCVEISYESVMHYFWWNINEMKKNGISNEETINKYRQKIKEYVKLLRVSKRFPIKRLIQQYYIAFLKRI